MKTQQELQDRTTPEFIKWCCGYAEGFEYKEKEVHEADDCIWVGEEECPIDILFTDILVFSTLLHRAVEGWNKKYCGKISIHDDYIEYQKDRAQVLQCYMESSYEFGDYKSSTLTPCEMAILDCLLNIFGESAT